MAKTLLEVFSEDTMTDNGRNERELVVTVAFTIYPADIATIDSHAKDEGLNRSAGLRAIIREWRECKAREAGVGEEG